MRASAILDPSLEQQDPVSRRAYLGKRLRETVAWAHARSPHVRRAFDKAGIGVRDVALLDDLAKIPVTRKDDVPSLQAADPPFGGLLAVEPGRLQRIFASPGSDWAPLWEVLARPYAPGEIPEYVSVRHEETAVDPPGHSAAVALRLVLRRVEGEQLEGTSEQNDLPRLGRVDHSDQPQRHAREEAPVGARQSLEVLDVPDPVELRLRTGVHTNITLPYLPAGAASLDVAFADPEQAARIPIEILSDGAYSRDVSRADDGTLFVPRISVSVPPVRLPDVVALAATSSLFSKNDELHWRRTSW